ncbi:MAG TPA: hypothetical protein VFD84_19570 [Candidatus Binatia bacterium]|nr:hypothetical protein [Candidatus Binatia bacterium]
MGGLRCEPLVRRRLSATAPATGLWLQTVISAFVLEPFYPVLVYAVARGRDWIRLPALVYAELRDDVLPLILAWRMRRPAPSRPCTSRRRTCRRRG